MAKPVPGSPLEPPAANASAHEVVPGSAAWRQWFCRFITAVYFRRISIIHPERLPRAGPVLYLGLHRNGAVDGFVYRRVLREPVFMISSQLRRSWFARLFFAGIVVTRSKDVGDRALNQEALRHCLNHLRSGGELFVFPEGTSSLGPRHLPFKVGAAWLLLDYLESSGPALQVVPLAIHYTCPWGFRSRVEVVVGRPISTELPDGAARLERLKSLKRRVESALDEVGVNFPSDEHQQRAEQLASLATLDCSSYSAALKAVEASLPEQILGPCQELESRTRSASLFRYEGVSLFPSRSAAFEALVLCVISPFVLGAIFLNLPAYAAGWFAGKKFPDDRNVISLWKILVGIPVFALWMGFLILALLLLGRFWLAAAYVVITWSGLKGYAAFKRCAVSVLNALRYPSLRPSFNAARQALARALPHETC